MRKINLAATASALALMAVVFAPVNAIAGDMEAETSMKVKANNPDTPDTGTVTTEEVKQGARDAANAVSDTLEDVGEAVSETVEDIKTALTEKEPNIRPAPEKIDAAMTAEGMIGKSLFAKDRTKVGTIRDIILDAEGKARLVVIEDDVLMSAGHKLAAFDYEAVTLSTKAGDSLADVSEASMKGKTRFSYDAVSDPDVRSVPENGFSLKDILAGKLVDQGGSELAKIHNVTLQEGRPAMLIAGYGEILGLGGHQIALDFDAPELVRADNSVNLKLSAYQTEKFNAYKASRK